MFYINREIIKAWKWEKWKIFLFCAPFNFRVAKCAQIAAFSASLIFSQVKCVKIKETMVTNFFIGVYFCKQQIILINKDFAVLKIRFFMARFYTVCVTEQHYVSIHSFMVCVQTYALLCWNSRILCIKKQRFAHRP